MIQRFHRFIKNCHGVAAVEFAILAPFMITLFLGMVELSDLMMANRRVTVVSSTVGDLVGQASEISNDDLADVFDASRSIMAPFDTTEIKMRITSVNINLDSTVEVGWSDGYNISPYSPGDSFTLPNGIGAPGGSIIVAEVSYEYDPIIKFINATSIEMSDTFFVLPRQTLAIARVS